jgi:iron complex outermembrane recepter protein
MSPPINRLTFKQVALLLGIFVLGFLADDSAYADEADKRSFKMPAGPATETLRVFSEQAQVQLLYATDDVRDVKTNAVAGDFTPVDTLNQMLEGTPLVVVPDEKPGAFSIKRKSVAGESSAHSGQGVLVATATPTASSSEVDQTVRLDPFEVSTNHDIGYLADNTLSGTLFNTDLKDNAASIQVVTPELIQDLGAFNIKDVMAYTNNTAPDLDETTAGGNPPNGNFLSGTYSQFRVRGSDISQSVDYFIDTNLPIDMYNIDRVEESRGPNSVLFGIGSPAGVLNYSTKQAILGRSFGDLAVTVGSFDTLRSVLDYNATMDDDKLAFRLDLADYDDGSYRLFAGADGKQGSIAATYRLNPRIEIKARFEIGEIQDEGPRGEPLIDNGLVEWNAVGRPIYGFGAKLADPLNWGYYGTPGSYSIPATLTVVSHPGTTATQIINEAGEIQMNAPYGNPVVLNPDLESPTINELGPHGRRTARWETDSVAADVQLATGIFLQAAFNHLQAQTLAWNNPGDQLISADANEFLPNGQPNPDAGKLYLQGNAQTYYTRNDFDRGRLLFSAQRDFGPWLGSYHAAVSLEQDDDATDGISENEVWAGNPFGGLPEYDTVTRRTYVTEGQWNTYFLASPGDNNAFVTNETDPMTGRAFSSTMLPFSINSYRSRQRDFMGIVQAQFVHDLLSINAGARRDTIDIFTRGTSRDSNDVLTEDAAAGYETSQGGNTTSLGAVLHILKTRFGDFDLLADKSDNFGLAPTGLYDLTDKVTGQTTRPMPASTGTGNEWGCALTLLKGRISIKFVHFEDNTANLFNYIGEDEVGPMNDIILNALVNQGSISAATAASRMNTAAGVTPYNEADDGDEISLTANVTVNWRLTANFSDNNPNATWVDGGDIAFWDHVLKPYYAQFPENMPTNTDPYSPGATIAQLIALTDQQLALDTAVEGKGVIGFRKYKWNFFTRYTVSKTALKGLYFGGGYIFQSQMLIGTYPNNGQNLYGPKTGTASALLGYNTKIFSHPLRFQLNVLNAFNNTNPVIFRRETFSYPSFYYYPGATTLLRPVSLYFPDPRSYRLTADFYF